MTTTNLITDRYPYGTDLGYIGESETEKIQELLVGHKVTKVADDHLQLDDGTLLRVVPNEGGCACSAGDYYLTELNDVDNVITDVQFDYHPTGDGSYNWTPGTPYEPEQGYYRVFVYADNKKVNLLTVEGDDGNGYYGTGYSILVRKP